MDLESLRDLPGSELVLPGLADVAAERDTVNALLVRIAAPRLSACGLPVPRWDGQGELPEHRLYARLMHHADAHSRYNALLQRLVSFENALEQRLSGQRDRSSDARATR